MMSDASHWAVPEHCSKSRIKKEHGVRRTSLVCAESFWRWGAGEPRGDAGYEGADGAGNAAGGH